MLEAFLFIPHTIHEMNIKKRWLLQIRAERIRRGVGSVGELRLHIQRGAQTINKTPHLDRKVRACFPRGPAFKRMVKLEANNDRLR